MAEKNLKHIKQSIIEAFKRDFPGESTDGKIFMLYIMDRYSNLLYRIYKKVEEK